MLKSCYCFLVFSVLYISYVQIYIIHMTLSNEKRICNFERLKNSLPFKPGYKNKI